jgi:hypothetical protein
MALIMTFIANVGCPSLATLVAEGRAAMPVHDENGRTQAADHETHCPAQYEVKREQAGLYAHGDTPDLLRAVVAALLHIELQKAPRECCDGTGYACWSNRVRASRHGDRCPAMDRAAKRKDFKSILPSPVPR